MACPPRVRRRSAGWWAVSCFALGVGASGCGGDRVGVSLFPRPASFFQGEGALNVSSFVVVVESDAPVLVAAAKRYRDRWSGRGAFGDVYRVRLTVDEASRATAPQLSDFEADGEAYDLVANHGGASIEARSVWGVLRGLATFSQVVLEGDGGQACVGGLPLTATDGARFPWRGLLLDTARRFYPVTMLRLTTAYS